jgi:hypothetical protein
VVVIGILLIITLVLILSNEPKSNPVPDSSGKQFDGVQGYLNSLYPLAKDSIAKSSDAQRKTLYDSLDWYYLPLVRDIPIERRSQKGIKGPYTDAETQWFMADGADCGNAIDQTKAAGTFTCSVFGGACDSWEFGKSGSNGRPYQNICMIKPYGRRDGAPNNSFIECVAFVCEGLGKMLLNAPDCGSKAPKYTKETFAAINCPSKASCSDPKLGNDDPGCQVGTGDQLDTCCWNYSSGQMDNSVCKWPMTCAAIQDTSGGPVYNNYCTVPCGYSDCDVTSGNCDWFIDGKKWIEYIQSFKTPERSFMKAETITRALQSSKPMLNGKSPSPRPDVSLKDTMFYWCKGYGKFLNMGKTGVYFNYFHFLLTMPKLAADGTPIRWSFPQILQTATMAGGNQELYNQLNILMSGEYKQGKRYIPLVDKRKYLEGYSTTLRGPSYEGKGGVQIENKMVNETMNVSQLINPLDDDNLVMVDKMTVTKYYDPNLKIINPQYNKQIKFTPLEAIMLLQGMHIYGSTGNDTERPFVTMTPGEPWTKNSGVYPFGVFFDGANLGHCVYQSIKLCGWDSAQFTQMPTGAGGTKYCNYPEYDYEIVYIRDKQDVCKNELKMLDPFADYNNYVKYGYISGDADTKVTGLDSKVMKLSERNVPSDWTGLFPNSLAYGVPNDYAFFKDFSKCPYSDNVYNKFPSNPPNVPYK